MVKVSKNLCKDKNVVVQIVQYSVLKSREIHGIFNSQRRSDTNVQVKPLVQKNLNPQTDHKSEYKISLPFK